MLEFEIIKRNFDTAIDEKISFGSFNFLSIYSDGVFNPNLNRGIATDSEFYIETSLNEKYVINQEILNLKLNYNDDPFSIRRRNEVVRDIHIYYNKLSSAFQLSGGYGNIYIVKSVRPFYPQVVKNFASAQFHLGISSSQNIKYWFGENALNGRTLLIPYINPHIFMTYFFNTGASSYSAKLYPYNIDSTDYADPIDLTSGAELDTEIMPNQSLELSITNNDGSTQTFYGYFIFHR